MNYYCVVFCLMRTKQGESDLNYEYGDLATPKGTTSTPVKRRWGTILIWVMKEEFS